MNKILLFIVLMAFGTAHAQDDKVTFGKVSIPELEQKFYPKDSTAPAAYLYRDVRVYYDYVKSKGFVLMKEVHERIKIYSKEGLEYANQNMRYYVGGNLDEKITNIKGKTYNLNNGVVSTTELSKSGIFDEDMNKYWAQKKIALPNVREGSVVEYKYKLSSPYIRSIDEIPLQYFVPVKYQNVRIEIPEYYVFKPNVKGYLLLEPEITKGRERINFVVSYTGSGRLEGASTTSRSRSVDYATNKMKYIMRDVPALKREPLVNSMRNYLGAIKFELQYTRFPDSPLENYSTSWENVAETIYNDFYKSEIEQQKYFIDALAPKLQGVESDLEKMAIIFNHVKSKMTWNGFESVAVGDGVKKAYQEGKGDVAEINLMLLGMLKYAGLEAYPVLVSTRDNGIPVLPTIHGFNYVVVAVQFDDGVRFLDATSPFSMPNLLPDRALNWYGRVILEDGTSSTVNLIPKYSSKKIINMMVDLTENGDISGRFREQNTNHLAKKTRIEYGIKGETDFVLDLAANYDDIEISNYKIKHLSDLAKAVIQDFEIYKEDQLEVIDGKLYFEPMFFLTTKETPFKSSVRNFPVDFTYPNENKYLININIPEGYKVERLPEATTIALPDNIGSFKFKAQESPTGINVSCTITINQSVIGPNTYPLLQEFFNTIIKKQQERIVLSR
ncbi:MAG: DUF3857 domain-containing protein [Gilvibacter sp.]